MEDGKDSAHCDPAVCHLLVSILLCSSYCFCWVRIIMSYTHNPLLLLHPSCWCYLISVNFSQKHLKQIINNLTDKHALEMSLCLHKLFIVWDFIYVQTVQRLSRHSRQIKVVCTSFKDNTIVHLSESSYNTVCSMWEADIFQGSDE